MVSLVIPVVTAAHAAVAIASQAYLNVAMTESYEMVRHSHSLAYLAFGEAATTMVVLKLTFPCLPSPALLGSLESLCASGQAQKLSHTCDVLQTLQSTMLTARLPMSMVSDISHLLCAFKMHSLSGTLDCATYS